MFDTRVCVPGHLQQGGAPSPADRLLASQLAVEAVRHLARGVEGPWVMGERGDDIVATPLSEALACADLTHRRRAAMAEAPERIPFWEQPGR